MNKAVGYIRISTNEQSLNRQHEDLKTFAKTKNLDLEEIFEDIISGSKTGTHFLIL
jgi:DNA invertase Pin-like site-specific DNA recombinase